jgi:uncharacterized membrane protein YozB (DUF420 family)
MPFAEFNYHDIPCAIGVMGFSGFDFTEVSWIFWILRIFTSALIVLLATCIFLHKKRTMQLRMVLITFLVNIVLIALYFLFTGTITHKLQYEGLVEYTVYSYIPIITVLLLSIIQRKIKKDEALVRSMDRLR